MGPHLDEDKDDEDPDQPSAPSVLPAAGGWDFLVIDQDVVMQVARPIGKPDATSSPRTVHLWGPTCPSKTWTEALRTALDKRGQRSPT